MNDGECRGCGAVHVSVEVGSTDERGGCAMYLACSEAKPLFTCMEYGIPGKTVEFSGSRVQ